MVGGRALRLPLEIETALRMGSILQMIVTRVRTS